MISNTIEKDKPSIFFKTTAQLSHVEKWVEFIQENSRNTQLTVMFKLGKYYQGEGDLEVLRPGFKDYWKNLLGPKALFGLFFNQDIGTVFVAGPYSPVFLQEVDGKKLGAMSEGIYGILRGLGLNDNETTLAITKLAEGRFLLLCKTWVTKEDHTKYFNVNPNRIL